MLGQYSPAESPERSVLVVSHPELLTALSDLRPSAGFFSAIRIGLISVNGNTLIPLQNPEYMGMHVCRMNIQKLKRSSTI